jgi:hypothetical protein
MFSQKAEPVVTKAKSSITIEQATDFGAIIFEAKWCPDLDNSDFWKIPDVNFSLSKVDFEGLHDLTMPGDIVSKVEKVEIETEEGAIASSKQDKQKLMEEKLDLGPGFSAVPDPELPAASLGQNKQKSEKNNCWSLL